LLPLANLEGLQFLQQLANHDPVPQRAELDRVTNWPTLFIVASVQSPEVDG
jgi:hypothetical protein